MQAKQNLGFVPAASRPVASHSLAEFVPPSGLVNVSFRVRVGDVPRWLEERTSSEFRGSLAASGRHIEFDYTKFDKTLGSEYNVRDDLHSIGLDASTFATFGLRDVYWVRIDTQKGMAGVIHFWFAASDAGGSLGRLHDLFAELCGETWDYLHVYVNPGSTSGREENLSLVLKGASKKPVGHRVSIGLDEGVRDTTSPSDDDGIVANGEDADLADILADDTGLEVHAVGTGEATPPAEFSVESAPLPVAANDAATTVLVNSKKPRPQIQKTLVIGAGRTSIGEALMKAIASTPRPR